MRISESSNGFLTEVFFLLDTIPGMDSLNRIPRWFWPVQLFLLIAMLFVSILSHAVERSMPQLKASPGITVDRD